MPPRYRKITRINPDGTAWVSIDDGNEIPVQLVMNRNGVIGAVVTEAEDALGIDQGPAPPPPPPIKTAPPRVEPNFDISGLDQT